MGQYGVGITMKAPFRLSSKGAMNQGLAHGLFGFRISDFLRNSALEFRISPAVRFPAKAIAPPPPPSALPLPLQLLQLRPRPPTVNRLRRHLPALRQRARPVGHKQRRRRIQQHRVSLRPPLLPMQNSADDSGVELPIAPTQVGQRGWL